jgi:hypothetical protein
VNRNTATKTLDDLAERIGQLATAGMLVLDEFDREQFEIAGFLAAAVTLGAAEEYFDADAFGGFVETLRNGAAWLEERSVT